MWQKFKNQNPESCTNCCYMYGQFFEERLQESLDYPQLLKRFQEIVFEERLKKRFGPIK